MNTNFENFRLKLSKISDTVTERSYYPIICEFIQNFRVGTTATPEESLAGENKNVGFPDITVRRQNGDQVGWWEIKLPNDTLGKDSFQIQFSKYKDALENILFTNLHEWQLWQWDQDGKPQKVAEIIFDIKNYAIGEEEKLENLLLKFFEYSPYLARTPKQLALALAKKARFLSKQVEEAVDENDKNSDLTKLKQTFESTLIQDIGVHQFSNMIAETLAYSLFLAFLEHIHRGKNNEITLTTAIDYLPKNIPILFDLYSLVTKVSKTIPTIFQATNMLLDQLKFSDMEKIYHKLVEHKPGEDPVIQFYEPFLKEYDPKEREARGVYYTPKPVVDFIIRSVDYILREKFGKEKGLADESVHLLDPATGTGTFLMSAIQQIYENVKKENINQGEEMVQKSFNKIVIDHILKHFYGFELMVAPYAIAHLKLTLLLENLGFNFEMTKNDNDPDNDRLKVYLANTLDDPERLGEQGKASTDFGAIAFPAIPDESEKARLVKKNAPILVITGNPPYSGLSLNMDASARSLVERYKFIDGKRVKEKGALQLEKNLNDDYIKFISFSQSLIEKNRSGIIALITNNGYLDNPTLRGLRYNILRTFDEIFILNLHGNAKKRDKVPLKYQNSLSNDEVDENIFESVQGVGTAIIFLIKFKNTPLNKVVHYGDLWGRRKSKWSRLGQTYLRDKNNQSRVLFEMIFPKNDQYYFVPVNEKREAEYSTYIKITDLMPLNSIGLITAKDKFLITYTKERLLDNVTRFRDFVGPVDLLCRNLEISNKKGWNIDSSQRILKNETNIEKYVQPVLYRPFDIRFTFYHKSLIWSMAQPVLRNYLSGKNIGLITSRLTKGEDFKHSFVAKNISEVILLSSKTSNNAYPFPLYIYPEINAFDFNQEDKPKSNFNLEIVEKICSILGLEFIHYGRGDLTNNFGPEDLFYYIYSILGSSAYRQRYCEQLKKDFPRIPLISSKELFKTLVAKGNELVNLHLLGENPFDKSKTIFDDREKWNIKIDGIKPENLEDWKVTEVRYEEKDKRVYVNPGQYFEGVEKEVWEFMIGGYQVCEKWLKDRKKAERKLNTDDLKHYMKIVVSLRETIRMMKEIDEAIPEWPIN